MSALACPQCGAALPEGHAAALCPACLLKLGFESRDPLTASTAAYQPKFLAPTPEELAPHFPELEILERIGVGGMGVVYRARQKSLDRIVALKILRPDFGPQANFSDRFQREAQALAKLTHPHIVTVHDFGRRDDLYYFVMEHIDGVNLRQLERSGQLTPAQALTIVPQVCSALQFAHEKGVVHRDIKPENILVTSDGRVKIADFGLAKLAGHVEAVPLTGTWQVMGTPHYMAPEQVERPLEVDHRADIYSLGVVIYEMLTGELPLGRFPLPSRKAQVDIRLDDVVLRALEKEPGMRYQRVTEVQTDVEQIQKTPNAKPTPRDVRYLGEPALARARVLSDLDLSANALAVLGLVELLTAVPVACAFHWAGLLMFPMGVVSLWTGLNLKHGQNARETLAGCILSLIPASLLWPIKLPFIVLALLVLRVAQARSTFPEVPWQESGAWLTIHRRATAVREVIERWAVAVGSWIRARTPDWVKGWFARRTRPDNEQTPGVGPTPDYTRPTYASAAGNRVLSTIRHPIARSFAGWLITSLLWSAFCLAVSMFFMTLPGLREYGMGRHSERLLTSMGLFGLLSWLLGEGVLTWSALTTCITRLNGHEPAPTSGPRAALLMSSGGVGFLGLLILGIAAFDLTRDVMHSFGLLLSQSLDVVGALGVMYVLHAMTTGLAALCLSWTSVRYLTRGALFLCVLLPLMALIPAAEARLLTVVLLALFPLALAAPAILWGLWGTRRPAPPRAMPRQVVPETATPEPVSSSF